MKLLGGRLSAVMLLAVLNGALAFCAPWAYLFRRCWHRKGAGREHPLSYGAIAGLCVGCGVLRGGCGIWSSTATTISPSGCWRCFGIKSLPSSGPLPRQAGKPPEGQPSHHDHGGHRNAGGILCPHRFPRLHRRACVIGGDGGHRPCCKLVSVPDRCGGLSVHRRSAAPVFLPPHGRDRYAVQTGAWETSARIFSTASRAYGSWFSTTPERPDAGRTGAGRNVILTGGYMKQANIQITFEEEKLRALRRYIAKRDSTLEAELQKGSAATLRKGRPCCRAGIHQRLRAG